MRDKHRVMPVDFETTVKPCFDNLRLIASIAIMEAASIDKAGMKKDTVAGALATRLPENLANSLASTLMQFVERCDPARTWGEEVALLSQQANTQYQACVSDFPDLFIESLDSVTPDIFLVIRLKAFLTVLNNKEDILSLICFDAELEAGARGVIDELCARSGGAPQNAHAINEKAAIYRARVEALLNSSACSSSQLKHMYNPVYAYLINGVAASQSEERTSTASVIKNLRISAPFGELQSVEGASPLSPGTESKMITPVSNVNRFMLIRGKDGDSLTPPKVLMVDDQVMVHRMQKKGFTSHAQGVDVVSNEQDESGLFLSAQAVLGYFEQFEFQPPVDLLIVDQQMPPGMLGSEMLCQIRDEVARRGLPMLLSISLTGNLDLDFFNDPLEMPGLVCFSKPMASEAVKMIGFLLMEFQKESFPSRNKEFARRLLFKPEGRDLTVVEKNYYHAVDSGKVKGSFDEQRDNFDARMALLCPAPVTMYRTKLQTPPLSPNPNDSGDFQVVDEGGGCLSCCRTM
jgi:CheY-like chemotaxis protein